MVQSKILLSKLNDHNNFESFDLFKHFFVSSTYFKDEGAGVEEMLLGLAEHPTARFDSSFSPDLKDLLNFNASTNASSDLLSRNIQRKHRVLQL